MSKADDELFGLKSSRTGEYLHSKSADEMFKEIGYKFEERKYADVYVKTTKDLVRQFGFNKTNKSLMIDVHFITMQELQAINEKCRELGWIGGEDE